MNESNFHFLHNKSIRIEYRTSLMVSVDLTHAKLTSNTLAQILTTLPVLRQQLTVSCMLRFRVIL